MTKTDFDMKKTLLNIFLPLLISVAGAVSVSCEKAADGGEDTSDGGKPGVVEGEVLGTYEFDGQASEIRTAVYSVSDSYLMFRFSPANPGEDTDSFVIFGCKAYWADGEQHDISLEGDDLYHNDDYILIYSDSGHYYSEYREPQAGTFTVNNVGNGFFMVEFDFSLADGKPLKMDFFNEMQDGSVE